MLNGFLNCSPFHLQRQVFREAEAHQFYLSGWLVSPWDLPLFPSPVPVAGFHVGPGASHDYRTGALPTECLRSPKLITF